MAQNITDEKFNELISSFDKFVVGFIAPTGSGKSTMLVQRFIDAGKRVWVAEPTVEAVRSLYYYMHGKGNNVGYAAESQVHNYGPQTSLIYCTGGHLESKMRSYFTEGKAQKIDFCDILIMDEAHRGTLDQDLILGLYKEAMEQRVPVPRVLLMSATLSMSDTPFPDSPVVVFSPKSKYTVTVEYHNQDYEPDSKDLYNHTISVILKRHKEVKIPQSGDAWLVFVPGVKELGIISSKLSSTSNVDLVRMGASIPEEERERAYSPLSKKMRRIIVATNIAEASITIVGLSGIFDTMTERYGEATKSEGYTLKTGEISQSSARQRAGRTGRTCNGFCYRMCTPERFKELPEQRLPEIKRLPLHSMIIKILSCGLDPEKLFEGRPREKVIERSIELLRRLGMIEKHKNNIKITEIGQFAPKFPLSVRASAVLWHWIERKLPVFPGIVMASLINSWESSFIWYPRFEGDQSNMTEYNRTLAKHYSKYISKYDSTTEIEALIKIWHHLMTSVGTLVPNYEAIKDWCLENSFNAKKIKELLTVVVQTINRCTKPGQEIKIGRFSAKGVLEKLVPILKVTHGDNLCILTNLKKASYSDHLSRKYILESRRKLISGKIAERRKLDVNATEIIVVNYMETWQGLRISSLSMPVNPDYLPQEESEFINNPIRTVEEEISEEEEDEEIIVESISLDENDEKEEEETEQ